MTEERIALFIDAMPVSTNRIWLQNYRTGRTYLNPQYKLFRQIAKLRVGGERMPTDWKYCAVAIVVHPRRRIGDSDNYTKCILDSLTYAGFWPDDKVVAKNESEFGTVDKRGSVEIFLTKRDRKFPD